MNLNKYKELNGVRWQTQYTENFLKLIKYHNGKEKFDVKNDLNLQIKFFSKNYSNNNKFISGNILSKSNTYIIDIELNFNTPMCGIEKNTSCSSSVFGKDIIPVLKILKHNSNVTSNELKMYYKSQNERNDYTYLTEYYDKNNILIDDNKENKVRGVGKKGKHISASCSYIPFSHEDDISKINYGSKYITINRHKNSKFKEIDQIQNSIIIKTYNNKNSHRTENRILNFEKDTKNTSNTSKSNKNQADEPIHITIEQSWDKNDLKWKGLYCYHLSLYKFNYDNFKYELLSCSVSSIFNLVSMNYLTENKKIRSIKKEPIPRSIFKLNPTIENNCNTKTILFNFPSQCNDYNTIDEKSVSDSLYKTFLEIKKHIEIRKLP
jgi:hypothetical protein